MSRHWLRSIIERIWHKRLFLQKILIDGREFVVLLVDRPKVMIERGWRKLTKLSIEHVGN